MAYSTTANIVSELRGITFSASTTPTSTAVAEFIDQADAIIDMHIGGRYDTPVTSGTKSLNILKKISIDLVVYRVAKILSLSKSMPIPAEGVIQEITEGSAYRESMKMLIALRDNKMNLPDADLVNASNGLASFHSESGNSDIVPLFDKEEQQW